MSESSVVTSEEIQRLYADEELSFQQIVKRLGITEWRVQQSLDGIPKRPKGRRPGSTFTSEQRAVLSDRARTKVVDPEVERLRRTKISKTLMGHTHSEETRQKISQSMSLRRSDGTYDLVDYSKTTECRERISRSVVRAYAEGRLVATGYYRNKSRYYAGHRMRSQSEVKCAESLDRLGIEWVYEPERFDLGWCTYLPDFYLPELKVYLEVKAVLDKTSQRKVQSFSEEHDVRFVWYQQLWSPDVDANVSQILATRGLSYDEASYISFEKESSYV